MIKINVWNIIWGLWALIIWSEVRTIIHNQGVIVANQDKIHKKLSELS